MIKGLRYSLPFTIAFLRLKRLITLKMALHDLSNDFEYFIAQSNIASVIKSCFIDIRSSVTRLLSCYSNSSCPVFILLLTHNSTKASILLIILLIFSFYSFLSRAVLSTSTMDLQTAYNSIGTQLTLGFRSCTSSNILNC
jgi:hypothetical protein